MAPLPVQTVVPGPFVWSAGPLVGHLAYADVPSAWPGQSTPHVVRDFFGVRRVARPNFAGARRVDLRLLGEGTRPILHGSPKNHAQREAAARRGPRPAYLASPGPHVPSWRRGTGPCPDLPARRRRCRRGHRRPAFAAATAAGPDLAAAAVVAGPQPPQKWEKALIHNQENGECVSKVSPTSAKSGKSGRPHIKVASHFRARGAGRYGGAPAAGPGPAEGRAGENHPARGRWPPNGPMSELGRCRWPLNRTTSELGRCR